MPGAGKSTAGVLLAKALSLSFVDTDVVIQGAEGARLQNIIQSEGVDAFCAIEERSALALDLSSSVLATGGSVVYSDKAMGHLKKLGTLVYLHVSLNEVIKRVGDPDVRGIVRAPGMTLDELYAERLPLYERYADLKVECTGLDHKGVVQAVVSTLEGFKKN